MRILDCISWLCIFAAAMVLVSCDDDDAIGPVVEVPAYYEFDRNGQTTVSFDGQTTRILMATELVNTMKDFNTSEESMLEMFANQTASGGDADPFENADLNSSTKSVKSKTAASSDFFASNTSETAQIIADFESWIGEQVNAVFPNEGQLAEPGKAGQIADGTAVRYVSPQGMECDQLVNKGLIGALMVDQMVNNYLGVAVLDAADNIDKNNSGIVADGENYTTMEHKWDEAYGYLFGASSDPSNPLPALGEDAFLNKYLARVEGDPDFQGIASTIFDAFKLGRAAIVAGDYDLRDEQANIIREEIAKVIAVRAVYYLQQGKNALPESGNDFGPAFHDLSEGFGFIYSLRFTRIPNTNEPYFTRQEVDSMIDRLAAGNGFWDLTAEILDQMSDEIAAKFNFTVEQAGS